MRFLDDSISFTFAVFLPFALIAACSLCLLNWHDQYQCGSYQDVTGKNTKFVQFDSCYVETKYGFQRLDEYKTQTVN